MRVLIAGTTYYPALNGQAIFTVNLAEGLAARGHEVVIMYPAQHDSTGRRNGVRLEPVRSTDLAFIHQNAAQPLFAGRRVRRVLDDFRPDIVHVQDHYPLSLTLVREARRRGLKTIGTNHFIPANVEPYIPGSAVLRPVLDWVLWRWMLHLFQRLDFVTAPSQAAVNLIRAHGLRAPALPVSCGVDLGRFHPDASVDRAACRLQYGLDPKRRLFLCVGRVDREKRLDVLIDAFALLQRDDIQLAIAGQGAVTAELHELIQTLRLKDRVNLLGRVPNEELPRLLVSADMFVMASEAELLSISSLEAMASGLPLLLANALALTELVTPGLNGYLFKAGDAQDAAHYMGLLASQPERWQEMGRLSLEKVRPHSLENTMQRYESLYKQVLESSVPVAQPAAAHVRHSGISAKSRELPRGR